MKRFLVIMLACVLVAGSVFLLSGQAQATTVGSLSFSFYDGQATVTRCDPKVNGEVVIPSVVEGCPVTAIGSAAFRDCTHITGVVIPGSVKRIETSAFSGCIWLGSVTISEGVSVIAESTFLGCQRLASITIPSTVTEIGHNAFSGCDKLTDVYITDLTAWLSCTFVSEYSNPVRAGSTPTKLYLNNALVEDLVIPAGVSTIKSYAFNRYSGLKSLTIPGTVTHIEQSAFSGCVNLARVTMAEGVTHIGINAFSSCSALTDLTIPESVKTLNNAAFKGCRSLPSVTIPTKLTTVGMEVFADCVSLKSVTVPDGITKITRGMFSGCTGLTDISIPKTVTLIENNAFYNCTGMTDFDLPCGVTRIGSYAFEGCTGLTGFTVPGNTTTIDNSAFTNCTNLESIMIPVSVNTIELGAFSGCNALKDVYYTGTQAQWNNIYINELWDYNAPLLNATLHCDYVVDVSKPGISGSITVPALLELRKDGILVQEGTYSGTYSFEDLTVGDYTLMASQDGYASVMYEISITDKDVTNDIAMYQPEELVTITNALELEGAIGVHYYVKLLEGVTAPTMQAGTYYNDSKTCPGTLRSDGRYGFRYDIYAMEMADIIYSFFTVKKGNGLYMMEHEYAAQTYAEKALASTATTQELKNLVAALMNYGAYAQLNFGHNTEHLANSILASYGYSTDLNVSDVANVSRKFGTDFTGTVLAIFTGNSLELNEQVTVRYNFTLDSSVDPSNVYLAYKDQDSNEPWRYVKAEYNSDSARFYGAVRNIASYKLATMIDAYVCVKNGDSYTQISQVCSYSAECYANTLVQLDDPNREALTKCVIAMMTYGNIAKAMYG